MPRLLYEVSNEGLALCIHLLTRRGWYATNHTNPAGGPLKAPLASTKANDVVYPLSLSNPIFYRYLPLEFYLGGASKEPPASGHFLGKPALYP